MKEPSRGEDTKNVTIISVATAIALIATVAFIADSAPSPIDIGVPVPTPSFSAAHWTDGPARSDRLYGTVLTRSGESFEGYLRWDRNEGAWLDLLNATKDGRTQSVSGIRFGHIAKIEVLGSHSALFTLRSGGEQLFREGSTDLGEGLRALQVEDRLAGVVEMNWSDLSEITFSAAPDGSRPVAQRLYGTMVTRAGAEFTGYVTWDVDEIFTTDILDGEIEGVDEKVAFGEISSIERADNRSARVRLGSGEQVTMSGTNDVNSSNRGISIADANLGHVSVEWGEFEKLELFDAPNPVRYEHFDEVSPLYGTVTLASGEHLEGRVVWDNDEAFSWEMLNGESEGAEFHVEFANIETIERSGRGVVVGLRDLRTLELSGSNDVGRGNRGILVTDSSGRTRRVEWEEFQSVRF